MVQDGKAKTGKKGKQDLDDLKQEVSMVSMLFPACPSIRMEFFPPQRVMTLKHGKESTILADIREFFAIYFYLHSV